MKDRCLKYGDLIILHFSGKASAQDGTSVQLNLVENRKEGFLGAMG
jgi:hypothetical protein